MSDEIQFLNQRIKELEDTLSNVICWANGGACADCKMFGEAPSTIKWFHHKDCAHLETINQARKMLGKEPFHYHEFDDPELEMHVLREQRVENIGRYIAHYLSYCRGFYYYLHHDVLRDVWEWTRDRDKASVFIGKKAATYFGNKFKSQYIDFIVSKLPKRSKEEIVEELVKKRKEDQIKYDTKLLIPVE